MKVLLIDDQAVLFRTVLKTFPAEMHYAENEKQALEILARVPIDCILMDSHLGSTWGADVVKRFRARGLTVKIIMFSSDDDDNAEGVAAGADGAWSKSKIIVGTDWMHDLLKILSPRT